MIILCPCSEFICNVLASIIGSCAGVILGCFVGTLYKSHLEYKVRFYKAKCDLICLQPATYDEVRDVIPYDCEVVSVSIGDLVYMGVIFKDVSDIGFNQLFNSNRYRFYITPYGRQRLLQHKGC